MNNLSTKKILLIGRRWSTRGLNNDFEHFLSFFPGSIHVTNKELGKFDNRIYRFLKFKSGNSCYSSLSVALEHQALMNIIKHKIKVVHYWFGDHDYYYGYWLKRIFGVKLVINLFFSIEELEGRMPNKSHLQEADLITCSGYAQLDYLKQFIDEKKLAYLPLGVDTNFFSFANISNRRDKNLIVCIGNNRRDYATLKNIYLKIKLSIPHIKLKLAGAKPGKVYFKDLPEVEFLPFLNDIEFRDLYRKASLLVLPLLEGGSSQTINEALSSGLPIVTNDHPNLSDYTRTGAVIKHQQGDYNGMANSCIKILSNEKELLKMAKLGRRFIEKYDFINIKNKLLEIYSKNLDLNLEINN
tara:strand:- start:1381 stop:2445 length:1065 start_codon:yes stop_codon:yes gene_type:complete